MNGIRFVSIPTTASLFHVCLAAVARDTEGTQILAKALFTLEDQPAVTGWTTKLINFLRSPLCAIVETVANFFEVAHDVFEAWHLHID